MWARIIEIIMGIWLLFSPLIFNYEELSNFYLWSDIFTGLSLIFLAALSFIPKLDKLHLAEVFPALWLFYVSFSYPTPFLPFALQNYVVLFFLLLMFFIIPTRASKHPKAWEDFLNEHQLGSSQK